MLYLFVSFGIVLVIASIEYMVSYIFSNVLAGMIIPMAYMALLVFGHITGGIIFDTMTLVFVSLIAISLTASGIGGYIRGRELK